MLRQTATLRTPVAFVSRGPRMGSLAWCKARGFAFPIVGVTTTLDNSGYVVLPQIEARPTRKDSGLGPLSRSQAGRMVGVMTAGSLRRVAYCRPQCSATALGI